MSLFFKKTAELSVFQFFNTPIINKLIVDKTSLPLVNGIWSMKFSNGLKIISQWPRPKTIVRI